MNTNSVPENSARPYAHPLRGRWIAALGLLAILVATALGWLPAFIALPGVAIVAVFIALEMKTTSRGLAVVLPKVGSPRTNEFGAQLATMIDALPDPALVVDGRNELLAGNVAATAVFGSLRINEPISLTLRNPQIVEALDKATTGIAQNFEINEQFPVERSLDAHVAPLVFGEEQPNLFLLTFRDRTQEKRIEQMRVDFVANASHELRTPLASISGFIDTLRGPARDDPVARGKFLGIMSDQARRMSQLIDDLMSLSKIELSLHLQPQTKVNLADILDRACDAMSPLAKERNVTLGVKRQTAKLEVYGDQDELIRVFENLIQNALKFGAAGKCVEVTLSADGDEALVAVRDFGPGIAPEHLPRLTERFYRVDVEQSRAQGGTGLGLSLVKHILARHRGRLTIESEPGKGAIFTARIPVAR